MQDKLSTGGEKVEQPTLEKSRSALFKAEALLHWMHSPDFWHLVEIDHDDPVPQIVGSIHRSVSDGLGMLIQIIEAQQTEA